MPANLGLPAPGDSDSLSYNNTLILHTPMYLYWDPTAVPEGYDAIWDTSATEAYWRLGSPTGELTAWVNGADAVFGELGTPGAVTIDDCNDPNGPIWASSMTFETGGYSLVGYTECDTLSLASEGTPVEVDNGTATIALPIGRVRIPADWKRPATAALARRRELLFGTDENIGRHAAIGRRERKRLGGGRITNNAALRFAEAADLIFSGTIDGKGSVWVENDPGGHAHALSGALSYRGRRRWKRAIWRYRA